MDVRMLPPSGLDKFKTHEIPLLEATEKNLKGYGQLVDNYEDFPTEIVRWPAQGWRPVDADTGDEGGTTEGIFQFTWKGDILYGVNEAVQDSYLLGWCEDPAIASDSNPAPKARPIVACGMPITIRMVDSCFIRWMAAPLSPPLPFPGMI